MTEKVNSRNLWFTGDTHFGHKNIIEYANRPFKDADEMDEVMINNWNDKVKENDHIFHLGDFALCKPQLTNEIISKLNGHIHLCFGNHDTSKRRKVFQEAFYDTFEYKEIDVYDHNTAYTKRIILCHFPFAIWNKCHKGSWHLHGHSHGNYPASETSFYLDVGVDSHGYAPINFEDIKKIMSTKTYVALDHHGERE